MSDKISIVVPMYNAQAYIKRTLNSILSQTYKNIEVIAVDDGSKDNTLEICMSIAKNDERLKVFSKDNEGVTLTRDYAISKVTGDYIGFVDSDDTIEKNMYEKLYNNLIKYNADISHCGHKYIHKDGQIDCFYNTGVLKTQNHDEGLVDLVTGVLVGPSLCTKLYKIELIKKLKYDKSIKINEDYVMNLKMFNMAQKSVFEDITLYNYYMNDNSGSTKNTKEYFYRDILKAADFSLSYFKNNESVFPYVQRRWFKTYSDMYKNQSIYDYDKMEFDIKGMLKKVYSKLVEKYNELVKNRLMTFSDMFILRTIRYCPKILLLICKHR